jgi:DNA polymerase
MAEQVDPTTGRAARMVVQRLESLKRAGVTHLARRRPAVATAPNAAKPSASPDAALAPAATPATTQPAAGQPNPGRKPVVVGSGPALFPQSAPAGPLTGDRAADLAALAKRVALCTRCKELAESRTQTVFGTGSVNARLVFLGEAPGADEDRQGKPFVGRAGQLLTDMIEKGMKLRREEVYILNILKCRPPGNRTPASEEAENCREYLDGQLAILRPEFICCLGACAAQNLLGSTASISQMRGRLFDYQGAKVLCTYHPAYLLRNPPAKRLVWEDLQVLMKAMGLALPGK